MNSLTADGAFSIFGDQEDGSNWGHQKRSVTYRAAVRGLDLQAAEASLRDAAARRGMNLGDLLLDAGKHFRGLTLTAAPPPAGMELEILATDELRTTAG